MVQHKGESRLRTVVETAVDGVILIDAQGLIQMFNPACEKLFGYRADEVMGRNVKMLMPSPYRDEHDRYLDNFHRTGEKKIIGIGREVSGQRKDGSVFPMDLSVGEAKEGDASIFVGIIHDLSQYKRAEQEIRETAARLKALVETAVDGVIMIDGQGLIQMFNPACEKLFGYEAAEVIGQNVSILMPRPYREEHQTYLENFHRTGEKKIIGIGREVTGQRKDGSIFPMDLSVGEAKHGDGESIFVGIIHDLTERKQTEAQLIQAQKMETVGQLSGGIAHDFNNLLTVVVGNAEVLSESLRARPDLQHLADSIVAAGERGAELTQRLLAFSRRQTLQPADIDCNALVRGMEKLLRRMLPEAISVKTILNAAVWTAYADPRLSGSWKAQSKLQLIWASCGRLWRLEEPIDRTPVHEICAHETGEFEWAAHGLLCGLSYAQEEETDQGDRDLDADGVLGDAHETLDPQGLLDPTEE
jgi:PAS domain S-box-containing protein